MGDRAAGFTTSSECNRLGSSLEAMLSDLPFGGEWGGSTVRAGAGTARGVSCGGGNALRAGEFGSPLSLMARGARPGLGLGIGGGSLVARQEEDFRGTSARGPGDTLRFVVGGCCGGGGGCWPMFSKCDRREETGFCGKASVGKCRHGGKWRAGYSQSKSHQALPRFPEQPWWAGRAMGRTEERNGSSGWWWWW